MIVYHEVYHLAHALESGDVDRSVENVDQIVIDKGHLLFKREVSRVARGCFVGE